MMVGTSVYAYSSGFLYMVDAIEVEKINVHGLKINEEIYRQYNLFVYGSPTDVLSNKQRWKQTSNGKWTYGASEWNGSGIRGEYWILGEDYNGNIVHNELFPDDYNSGTSPVCWEYRVIKDAEESWLNTNMYQYEIQKDYMMNHNLSRFGIEYEINALNIGLDKARVENYATWGSAGSIYTEKPGEGNVYWVATFSVPPMAGSAELHSILETPLGKEYTIKKDSEYIEIPIEFGAYVDGLSEYAKPEHIKLIEAELKINGVSKNIASGTKKVKILKNGNILINREDYKGQKQIKLELECNSFLSTFFDADPLLYSNKKIVISVNIETEEKNEVLTQSDLYAPIIYDISVQRISSNSRGKEKLVDLYVTKKGRYDFVCAGQVIKVVVKTSSDASDVTLDFKGNNSIRELDNVTKKFEWDEPKERNEKTRYSSLSKMKAAYQFPKELKLEKKTDSIKYFSTTYVIPYETTQTLHSWNSLRNISQDAFNINESKLFTQKEAPYKIVVKATNYKGTTTKTKSLHVAERWDELYNRDISEYVK